MRKNFLFALIFALAFFAWNECIAQTGAAKGKGRLKGTVTDQNGKPLEGVTVRFSSERLDTSFELTTDEKGEWVAAGIAGANWNIDFIKEGYETRQISYMTSQLGYNKPVEMSLNRLAAAPPGTAEAVPPKEDDPSRALIMEGSALADQEDYKGAIAKYEEAMKVKPELFALYGEIGNLYAQMGEKDKALQAYKKLLEKDPSNQDATLSAAMIYFEQKDTASAKQVLSGLDLAGVTNANMLYNIGVGFYNANDPAEAIKYWEKTVELDSNLIEAYVQLGAAYLSVKQNDKAKAMLQKVIELDPNSENAKMAQEMLATMK